MNFRLDHLNRLENFRTKYVLILKICNASFDNLDLCKNKIKNDKRELFIWSNKKKSKFRIVIEHLTKH